MKVKELKAEIRKLTVEVNTRIAEIKSSGEKVDSLFNKVVNRLKKYSGVNKGYKGGEIGLGLNKSKGELESQLQELEAFKRKEWFSSTARKELQGKYKKAYETFANRYGDVTEEEWEYFATHIDDLKNYLKDFGYEDMGNSIARIYGEATSWGKWTLGDIVKSVGKSNLGQGKTSEDFIDALIEKLEKEGLIPSDEEDDEEV